MAGDSVAAAELRAFIERAERLNGEKDALNKDLSELFKEAKGQGYDTKVMKAIISDRAKDPDKKSEFDALYDLYAEALGMLVATRADAHDADGVFHDDETTEPQPETAVQMQTGRNQSKASPDRAESIVDGRSISVANTLGDAGFIDPIGWEAETTSQPTPSVATGEHVPTLTVLSRTEIAGSSNGRTAEFDSADAGSNPSPASNVTPLRAPKPIRPNCLNRDKCGASGPSECWSCTKAATRQGGAA